MNERNAINVPIQIIQQHNTVWRTKVLSLSLRDHPYKNTHLKQIVIQKKYIWGQQPPVTNITLQNIQE